MRFTKKRGYEGTVRKVWNDAKTETLGIVGTFEDLMKLGIIESVTNYSLDTWICMPAPGRIDTQDGIGATRDEAIKNTILGKNLNN